MTKPIQLHVGYVGITREGKRVEITNNDLNDTKWPWLSNHGQWYNDKGLAANYYKNSPQELDIVGPWVDTPVKPLVDYNDGQWHSWSGGECPVHHLTFVRATFLTGIGDPRTEAKKAHMFNWKDLTSPIIAFKVTKEYVEPPKVPREFWVYKGPMSFDIKTEKPSDTYGYVHVREVMTND
tara:strand:- start:29717 stop:30256 length:540 start_codon:yes stop_codon:yes gene_type:complete